MREDRPESLWSFGDPEPWRQGRAAIGWIGALVLIGHVLIAVAFLMNGNARAVFIVGLVGSFSCLLFFLIWIGQTWARWLIAPLFAIAGAFGIVWGIVHNRGLLLIAGSAAVIVFCYLALAPSVYAFARHQRERVGLLRALVIGGGFLLLIASTAGALAGFYLYTRALEREAIGFAQLTFHRVFVNRDPQFLEEHSSKARRYLSAQEFIELVDNQLGGMRRAGPFTVGSSRVDLQACKLEYSIVSPK